MNKKPALPKTKHIEFLQVVGGKAYNIGFSMCKAILSTYAELSTMNDIQLEDALSDGIKIETNDPESDNCLYKRVEYYK